MWAEWLPLGTVRASGSGPSLRLTDGRPSLVFLAFPLYLSVTPLYKGPGNTGLGAHPTPGRPHLNHLYLQGHCFQTRSRFEVLGLGPEHRNLGGNQPTADGPQQEGWMEPGQVSRAGKGSVREHQELPAEGTE